MANDKEEAAILWQTSALNTMKFNFASVTITSALLALMGGSACNDSKEDKPAASAQAELVEAEKLPAKEDPAAKEEAPAPAKTLSKMDIPEGDPVSSCDERKEKAYCTDAFQAGWSMGEEQVKSNCTLGTFAMTPCPSEGLLGHCNVGHAYQVAYYSGPPRNLTVDSAKTACEVNDVFAGTFISLK